MVADAIRADVGADVAIMNSGGIRGDRAYAAGPLTRRTIITMAPFGNVVCKIAAPGRVILDALNNGTSRLPFNDGRFPMISGMTMRVNVAAPVGSRVSDVMIAGQPLDLQKIYTVARERLPVEGRRRLRDVHDAARADRAGGRSAGVSRDRKIRRLAPADQPVRGGTDLDHEMTRLGL